MENEFIVLISMVLSGIIVYGINYINNIVKERKYNTVYKRLVYLKELDRQGKINKEVFFLDDKDKKAVGFQKTSISKKTEVMLYNKKYTDKTSWFVLEDDTLWILGKKENFLIQLNGKIFREEIGG